MRDPNDQPEDVVTEEEELYGTPTVPLNLVLHKADEDAEEIE